MKKRYFFSFLLLFFIIFGICMFFICKPQTNAELFNDLCEEVVIYNYSDENIPSSENNQNFIKNIFDNTKSNTHKQFKKLSSTEKVNVWKNINPLVVGTISILNLQDEPVINVPNDQNRYLHLDLKENYSRSGTLFTAQNSEFSKTKTTCIFGHAMNSGAMFGNLNKFSNLDFLKANPTFQISTSKNTKTCKIVGILYASANYELNDWYYAKPNLNEKEFEDFKFQTRTRSLYIIPDKFDYNSNYITLSTCSYNCQDERFLVIARIINENEKINTENYSINPSPLRTKEYYTKHKTSQPTNKTLQKIYEDLYNN